MPTNQDSVFSADALNAAIDQFKKHSADELKSRPDNEATMERTRQLSFGEQLVGLHFNPSNDDKVGQAKKLFAAAADLLKSEFDSREHSGLGATLYEHTIGEILNAQMNVVKVLTLKY